MSLLRNIGMILSLSCDESSRLLSKELDRTLSCPERIALYIHLALCRPCRRFRRNLRLFRDLLHRKTQQDLAEQGPADALSPEERARISETVCHRAGEDI